MAVFIPCLSADKPDSGGGFSVGIGPASSGGESPQAAVGVSFTHSDSPVTLTIAPFPPFIFFGPNFAFWADLFGLGETRIDREKQQIQDVLTGIFDYLRLSYDVPVRDNHALQFGSDGVRAQFARRPDIAALEPNFLLSSDRLAQVVFVDDTPSSGQRERIVRQYLANAAINDWPVSSTVGIWEGMLDATLPGCSDDPARWIKNPYIVLRAAEMALAIKYIGLPTMTNMATYHAIGDPIAERLVLQWANNPQLVSQIVYEDTYPWQGIYQRGEWAIGEWRYPLGGTVPLYRRQHFRDVASGVQMLRPRYPDFAPQPQGGVQPSPSPVPQPPSPTPTPQPPPPTPLPQPDPTPVPQPPGSEPGPQPYPEPPPQPPPPPPGQQVEEIPNAQEYRRACDISRQFGSGQPVSQADLDWIITVVGSKAITWAVNQPLCGYFVQGPNGPLPDPSQPDCPPFVPPQGFPPTGQVPVPIPQPQPYPDPQDPNRPCPPKCLQEIDILRDRQEECCKTQRTWVIPNIQNIWRWLTDVERRLPGPPPSMPPVPPQDPDDPPLLPIPPAIPPEEEPPGGGTPPQLPPGVVECIAELCDPEKFCQKVTQCERELECVEVPLCDEGGGPWGAMAECWLRPNTPQAGDVLGIHRNRLYPDAWVSAVRASYRATRQRLGLIGQGSGQQGPVPSPQSVDGRFITVSGRAAETVRATYKGARPVPQPYPGPLPTLPAFIFADPTAVRESSVKVRSVKLRPGEPDPCAVGASNVLEIPAAT